MIREEALFDLGDRGVLAVEEVSVVVPNSVSSSNECASSLISGEGISNKKLLDTVETTVAFGEGIFGLKLIEVPVGKLTESEEAVLALHCSELAPSGEMI
ncbi:hypothetical protein ACOSQ2_012814 [Xanthoceras sorbifolium]